MKFGYCIENFDVHLSPNNLIETAQTLEKHGFDSIWTTDHIMQKGGGRLPIYDKISEAIVTLAFLAGYTDSIKLGVSTLVLPIRNPILVAKQLASLDYLTNGRLVSSFAVGWNDEEFKVLGQNFNDRGIRMDQYITMIKELWKGNTSFKGTYFNYEDVAFSPLRDELRHQMFLIAGNSKHAINRAIKFGTGWHPAGGISGAEARKLLEPFENQLPDNFEIWVRKSILDQDIYELIEEYMSHAIDGLIIDLSRIKNEEAHKIKFGELIDSISNS